MNIRLKWFLVKNFYFFLCKTNLAKFTPEGIYFYFLDTEQEYLDKYYRPLMRMQNNRI
jgi:hypothetical protein